MDFRSSSAWVRSLNIRRLRGTSSSIRLILGPILGYGCFCPPRKLVRLFATCVGRTQPHSCHRLACFPVAIRESQAIGAGSGWLHHVSKLEFARIHGLTARYELPPRTKRANACR
jgi:hypothetical protein